MGGTLMMEKISGLECPKGLELTQDLLENAKCITNDLCWCTVDDGTCKFSMSFADSWICRCPTRQEIFKRLNK
jgi:hypothetical protein